ncbi:MAG: RNA polymerase sigma factor [Planctomycetota bacterium]|jgi:RNA polymerase sigma-70 factor (ECF subfamily)
MGQDDWLLMHRVADGDEGAVAELYDRFGSLVYKVARQLWQTADRYDPRRAKLVTWVMLIARRHLIDRLRRNAVRGTPGTFQPDAPDTQGGHRPEQRPQEDERNVSLMQRVAELPELQRVVIERAYLQGYTLREVSEQLEAPLGTVKSALSRGLARLRERAKADWAV